MALQRPELGRDTMQGRVPAGHIARAQQAHAVRLYALERVSRLFARRVARRGVRPALCRVLRLFCGPPASRDSV